MRRPLDKLDSDAVLDEGGCMKLRPGAQHVLHALKAVSDFVSHTREAVWYK